MQGEPADTVPRKNCRWTGVVVMGNLVRCMVQCRSALQYFASGSHYPLLGHALRVSQAHNLRTPFRLASDVGWVMPPNLHDITWFCSSVTSESHAQRKQRTGAVQRAVANAVVVADCSSNILGLLSFFARVLRDKAQAAGRHSRVGAESGLLRCSVPWLALSCLCGVSLLNSIFWDADAFLMHQPKG